MIAAERRGTESRWEAHMHGVAFCKDYRHPPQLAAGRLVGVVYM